MVSTFSIRILISVGNFGLPFKTLRLFRIFRLVETKFPYHLYSDQNFRNFWVNGKQHPRLQSRITNVWAKEDMSFGNRALVLATTQQD